MSLSSKRTAIETINGMKKISKFDADSNGLCKRTKQCETLLRMIHKMRGEFKFEDDVITGRCVLCSEDQSLSWYDWGQHLLNHTTEKRFYCIECDTDFANETEHVGCSIESIIDVYGAHNVGNALEGFICRLCNHFQINDYRLLKHLDNEHNDVCTMFETDVARVLLVPDVRPQKHIIHTGFAFIAPKERYRCGAGKCVFHGKTVTEFVHHFQKAHSTVKTFFCPHCKKIINRMKEPTISMQTILDHIDLHGRHLFQCACCSQVTQSEVAILTHLSSKHSEMQLKFWRNRRKIDGVDKFDLIDMMLDCNLCGERAESVTSAHDHFETAHPNCEINFKVITLTKVTTINLTVSCSIDDSLTRYREVLGCGLCDEYFSNKHEWFQHFTGAHPSQPLVAKRQFKWLGSSQCRQPMQTTFDKGMLFFCAFCVDSNGVKFKCYSSIDGVYEHWKLNHTRSNPTPFRFYMSELVACNYCDVMSTFLGLKEHVAKEHAKKLFIPLKAFEFRKKCALCNYDDDELIEHIQTKHSLVMQANVFNPIPVSDLNLWKLLRIGVHKKVKCAYCDKVFETKDEFNEHHSKKHSRTEMMYNKFFDTQSIKLIGDCCYTQIDPTSFFDHLAYHKYQLKCDSCSFQTTDSFDFVCHQVESHKQPDTIPSLYRNILLIHYFRSEFIFGNGLVVNKFNTIGTDFDYTKPFETFIDRLITEKMEEYEAKRAAR